MEYNTHQQRFHGLDHLRALAISLVFLFHYIILSGGEPKWLPLWADFGWTGVDLFFVLSGFLIAHQLLLQLKAKSATLLFDYFVKRSFRILPAFWLTLVVYYCVPFFREKEALPPLWKMLTFTQNIGLNIKTNGTFSHAWSLCVEEHFYLLLPLTLVLISTTAFWRKSWIVLVVLLLVVIGLRVYSYTHLYEPYSMDDFAWVYWYKYVYYPSYTRLDGLIVGVGIAAINQFKQGWWATITKYGNLNLLLGLIVLTSAWFLCRDMTVFGASVYGFTAVALGYGLLLTGALSSTCFLYRYKSRVSMAMAQFSYAVYLTHKGVIHMVHKTLASFELSQELLLFVSAVCCFAVAAIIYIVVEKPMLKLRNKLNTGAKKTGLSRFKYV